MLFFPAFDVNCPTLRRYDRSAAVDKELAAFRVNAVWDFLRQWCTSSTCGQIKKHWIPSSCKSSLTKSVSGLPVRRFYQNCRGLRSKLVNLRCNATALDHIFIILSETWLTNGIFDNELGLHNYNIFRCDRSSLTSFLTLSNQLFSRGRCPY